MKRSFFSSLLVVTLACGGASEEEPSTPTPVPPPLDLAQVEDSIEVDSLTPVPREILKSMRAAGLEKSIKELIAARDLDVTIANKDIAAVRTGAVAADAMFLAGESDNDEFLASLNKVRAGMANIGTGEGMLEAFDDLLVRVSNESRSRDDFLLEMESILGMRGAGRSWGPLDQTGPLVQAGAWLAGVNLVGKAILSENKPGAAQILLRHGDTIDRLLVYVRTEGVDRAPREGLMALDETLVALSDITRKSELLTLDDVQQVVDKTDRLLSML
jgi:hypothetical protein